MVYIAPQSFLIWHFRINRMLPFPFVTLGFPWLILFTISRLAFAINYSQFCFIPWLSLFNLGFTWLDLVNVSISIVNVFLILSLITRLNLPWINQLILG